jgi:hypothetical protein
MGAEQVGQAGAEVPDGESLAGMGETGTFLAGGKGELDDGLDAVLVACRR